MTPLKLIKQDEWLLPPAEQIQQIAAEIGVTAEIMPQDDLYAMWDAIQAADDSDLAESPTTLRSYLIP